MNGNKAQLLAEAYTEIKSQYDYELKLARSQKFMCETWWIRLLDYRQEVIELKNELRGVPNRVFNDEPGVVLKFERKGAK